MLPPPSDAALAAGKVIVNQFGVVPFVYMPLFLAVTGALGELGPADSLKRAKPLYFPLLKRNYFFWLPVQFFQFLVLPPDYQIPFLCCASLCWTVILSSISSASTVAATEAGSHMDVAEDTYGEEQDNELQLARRSSGSVNELTDSVSLEDVTNAAAELVPDAVSDALEGAASVVSDATVAGGLGLLASTAADAAIGTTVGGMIAESGEIGELVGSILNTGLGDSMGQTEVGIAAVSIISAGVGALISVTNNEGSGDDIVVDAVVQDIDTQSDGNEMGHNLEKTMDALDETFVSSSTAPEEVQDDSGERKNKSVGKSKEERRTDTPTSTIPSS